MVGKTLGHYEILEPLGKGGMGEVYRAKDVRLQRDVAIKVLPAELAAHPERRERFEREARAISNLNHPHICTLHDIGEQDDVDYLVMEYLEGETLGDQLRGGRLLLDEALLYGVQIAEALDAAHRQGIIHRDLKPGNVMLTKTGAKLLDFGLAKLALGAEAGPGQADERDSIGVGDATSGAATRAGPLTSEGTLLGTVQYMAPEQLEGHVADARSDIFAFGALLYEMVTGKPAFRGESKASLITAIMSSEPPPLSERQPATPALLERVIAACLAKDPDDRWQSAHDLARDLQWIAQGAAVESEAPGAGGPVARWKFQFATGAVVGVGVALLAMVGFLGIGGIGTGIGPEDRGSGSEVVRSVLPLAESVGLGRGRRPALAFSPDGTRIAYVAAVGNTTRLKVRTLGEDEAVGLSGTDGAEGPFFSPDGSWIGFFAAGALRKVPVTGGMPAIVIEAPDVRGAVWLPDDTIVFTPSFTEGLWRISASGGEVEVLTEPDSDRGEKSHRWPHALPGSEALLFTIGTTDITTFDDAPIAVLDLKTKEKTVLMEGGAFPQYTPSGHLVYARDAGLFAAPFDLERLEIAGSSVPVVEGVTTSPTYGTAAFSLSRTGSLAFVTGTRLLGNGTLVWVDRRGTPGPITEDRRDFLNMTVSPEGGRIALEVGGANDALWFYDLARGVMSRLTFQGDITATVWSPEGEKLAYTVPQPERVFWVAADGSGENELLMTSEHTRTPTSWSPDGKYLAFTETHPNTGADIWILPLEGDRTAKPYIVTRFSETDARFSPDGRWLVYTSNESGRPEVYVTSFPEPGRKVQISRTGGSNPRWSSDGRELFYRNVYQVMAVSVQTQGEFTADTPRLLFDRPYQAGNYDVGREGDRFVMVQVDERDSPDYINLVLNWSEELKRLGSR